MKLYTLKHPVTVGERTVTELKLNRPKTKDFIAIGEHLVGTVAADSAMLASICGESETIIKQIDIDDLSVLRCYLANIWNSYFTTKEYNENPTIPPTAAESV